MVKNTINIVAVGDSSVGKTSYIVRYTTKGFNPDHTETSLEICSAVQMIADKPLSLVLWDTGARDCYLEERKLAYKNADIILLTFSLVQFDTFYSIGTKWLPEIKKECPDTPYLLVGSKLDLRNDPDTLKSLHEKGEFPVIHADGFSLAKEIRAYGYFECSALTQEGIKQMFDRVIKLGLNKHRIASFPEKTSKT